MGKTKSFHLLFFFFFFFGGGGGIFSTNHPSAAVGKVEK